MRSSSLIGSLAVAGSLVGLFVTACGSGTDGGGGSGGGSTTTGATATSGGAGGATGCKPGESRACYGGPAGTENIGICHAGTQTCNGDGATFSACTGEKLPGIESCDAAQTDEDCNGKVNEKGANCVCGDGFVSNAEQCDDGNTTPNDGCNAQCNTEAVIAIAGGSDHSCAVLYDGRLKCWGSNVDGQLGLGDTQSRGDGPGEMGGSLPSVNLGTGRTATQVCVGTLHTCAILDDSTLKCWGFNSEGQLGLGNAQTKGILPTQMGDALPAVNVGTGRHATAIACGAAYTCAVLDNGQVRCWGHNVEGQLGQGTVVPYGTSPDDIGDNLPPVSLGTGHTAKAVAAGLYSTCVILDDSTMKCWGANNSGQLGQGDEVSRGDNPGELGDAMPPINLGTGRTVTQIAVGSHHACALLDNQTMKCWGSSQVGQVGQGDTGKHGNKPNQMGDALPAVDLGTGKKVLGISIAGFSTCARLDDGTTKCWGYNSVGQLGIGDALDRGDSPGEMGDALPAIDFGIGVEATLIAGESDFSSCMIAKNGRVKCWGGNLKGQLGLGDTTARGDGIGAMGDALPFITLFGNTW